MTPLPPYEHLELRPEDRDETPQGLVNPEKPLSWAQEQAVRERVDHEWRRRGALDIFGPQTVHPEFGVGHDDYDCAARDRARLLATLDTYPRHKPRPSRAVIGWLLVSLAVVLLSALAAWLLWRGFAAPSSGQQPPSTAAALNGAPQRVVVHPAKPVPAGTADPTGPDARGSAWSPAGVGSLPDTATAVTGVASWYCGGGSACTRGYPPGTLAAAAGPALRVGDWRGRIVKVCAVGTSRCVRVSLIDFCQCPRRVIDLYRAAFSRLASPSRGVLRVSVTWGGSAGTGLPPTDAE